MVWRLTSELMAFFVVGETRVYLSALEKKQYIQNTKKLIGDVDIEERRLYDNQFKLKIENNDGVLTVSAKSEEFPTDNWYLVSNFYTGSIWNFIKSYTITNGNFPDDLMFEACFSDDSPMVSFVEPGMDNFKQCFDEMRRRMNCELCKKTLSWVPGHRYDLPTETIYYLAKVKSRKESEFNSRFITEEDKMPEIYLYVNNIKDGDKNISDILKNRAFGSGEYDIKILYKKSLMCDSGKALENDFTGEIQDYWNYLFENANKNEYSVKNMLMPFSIVSKSIEIVSKDMIPRSEIEGVLRKTLLDIIIERWDVSSGREDLFIGKTVDINDNVDRLGKLLTSSDKGIVDPNFQKILYYKNLFAYLEIDLMDIVRNVIVEFMSIDFSNFSEFVKYKEYFSNPLRYPTKFSSQRVDSTSYKLDVTTISDLFGTSELTNTLINLINNVTENLGIGATHYSVMNMGNKKYPKFLVKCTVTLDDLIKFKKGVTNMSESLKHEIVSSKFVSLHIEFDKDRKIS